MSNDIIIMEVTRPKFDEAIRNNNLDYIILCDDESYKHYFNNHCFDVACEYGSIDIVKWLYENKQLIGSDTKPYNFACMNGHLEIIKYLDDNRINNHSCDSIKLAIKNNHRDVIEYLYKQNSFHNRYIVGDYADSEIIYYIKDKNYDMIKFLSNRLKLKGDKTIDIKYLLEIEDDEFIINVLNEYDINFKINNCDVLENVDMEIIELLYDKNILLLEKNILRSLIRNNLYDIIVYLVEKNNNFKIEEKHVDYALECYRLNIARYFYDNNELDNDKIWINSEQKIIKYEDLDDCYTEYLKYKQKHGVIICWLKNNNINDEVIMKIIKDYHDTYKKIDMSDDYFDYLLG